MTTIKCKLEEIIDNPRSIDCVAEWVHRSLHRQPPPCAHAMLDSSHSLSDFDSDELAISSRDHGGPLVRGSKKSAANSGSKNYFRDVSIREGITSLQNQNRRKRIRRTHLTRRICHIAGRNIGETRANELFVCFCGEKFQNDPKSVTEYLRELEEGEKIKYFRSEDSAFAFACEFFDWLKKNRPKKICRETASKRFVPESTKGLIVDLETRKFRKPSKGTCAEEPGPISFRG